MRLGSASSALGTLSGLNEDADGDASLRVTEFNLKWATDRLELLCGMLDASAVVDANAFAGEVCEVGFSGSLGLIWQGKTWPEGDAVGFALGVSRRSDEFVENNPGTPDGADLQMELFYRRRVNESFTLPPRGPACVAPLNWGAGRTGAWAIWVERTAKKGFSGLFFRCSVMNFRIFS